MTARMSASRPTGRHRSRVSLRRAVTPSVVGLSLPVLVIASVGVIGLVGASAATLGGLRTTDLGASDATVAIHTTGIDVGWTPLVSGTSWVLNGITLTTSGADQFAAQESLGVALINTSGAKICEIDLINPTATTTVSIARAAINTACGSAGIDFATIDRVAVSAARS